MSKKIILFINGIPDDQMVTVIKIEENGKINWKGSGSINISRNIKNDLFDITNLTFDTKGDQVLPRKKIHAVFNQISDADSHKITLKKVDDFYKAVSAHVPFFNPPSKVMDTTRDSIYQTLQGIDNLHVPKTVKIQPRSPQDIYKTIKEEGFELPVIFRQAGDHNGISTIKVDDETEQFYAFELDGRDYYLTQFVEYVKNGIYEKYRLIVVDGEVFLRHIYISGDWIVHSSNQLDDTVSHSYQNDISKHFNKKIKLDIQPIITEIHKRLGLDYFGIDCNIDSDMNLLIFEINANMNVFLKTKNNMIFSKHIENIRTALINMLTKKMK